jgi:cytochrome c
MSYRMSLTAALLALALAPSVQAADDGATLYVKKTCVACHGKDAKTPILPIYPKIAGQSAEYAFNQMNDIKSGARNNGQTAAMKGIMHLVSDEEIRTLANWLATLQ